MQYTAEYFEYDPAFFTHDGAVVTGTFDTYAEAMQKVYEYVISRIGEENTHLFHDNEGLNDQDVVRMKAICRNYFDGSELPKADFSIKQIGKEVDAGLIPTQLEGNLLACRHCYEGTEFVINDVGEVKCIDCGHVKANIFK